MPHRTQPKTTRLLILGAGTFAMEVADLASDLPGIETTGFVVNIPPYQPGSTLLNKPIYWIDDLEKMDREIQLICAIVSTKRWQFIQQMEEMGFQFTSIIHPTARVSRMATVGNGTLISSGVQVATHTRIGEHVIINRGALIGHHNSIGDYSTISPGSILAGNITIGRRVWIGLGAMILEKNTIGDQAVIGAGSLVTRDIPARVKAIGMPAAIIEKEIEGL